MAGLPLPSMLDAAGDGIRLAWPILKKSRTGKAAGEVFGNIKENIKKYINKKPDSFTRGIGTSEID